MDPAPRGLVTFLSDFGRGDIFVGVCHGVIADRAPHARIIDLTHDVEPHDVQQGAVLLARAVVHLPAAVHLAVVDPGVGTERRGVAVRTGRGDVLVGPDNGLLVPAAEALGGVVSVHGLTVPGDASATFHGRDVFAPAAGDLAAGSPLEDLGPSADGLVGLDLPGPQLDEDQRALTAPVLLIDRFGNLQLAASGEVLAQLGFQPGLAVTVTVVDREHAARVVRTFGGLAPGDLGVYQDSDRQVAVAVNGGSAAERTGARRGMHVTVRPAELADRSHD